MRSFKTYYFFLVLVFFAFLQSTVWPTNLVFLTLAIWSFQRSAKEILVTTFFAGLVLDFLTGGTLGVSSFWFLLILSLILLFRFRFLAKGSLTGWQIFPFVATFVFLGSLVLSTALHSVESGRLTLAFFWPQLLAEVITTVIFYPIFGYLSLRWQKENLQLQLKV